MWQFILKSLAEDAGYTGGETLAEVKTFIAEKGIPQIQNADGAAVDLDAEYKAFEAAKKKAEEKAFVLGAYDKKKADEKARDANRATQPAIKGASNVTGGERVADRIYNEKAAKGKTAFTCAESARLFKAHIAQELCTRFPAYINEGKYKSFNEDRELCQKAGVFPNSAGGSLVAPQYLPELIRLTEKYGEFRKHSRNIPMSTGEPLNLPRQTGFVSGSWTGESTSSSTVEGTYGTIALVANKRMATVVASSELINDSSLNYVDLVAMDIARDFARNEDLAGFNGDGTSSYGGFTGLAGKFRKTVEDAGGTWITNNAYNPGIVTASGNLASEVTYTDLTAAYGALPAYAVENAEWFMSQWSFANIFMRLAGQPAASGVAWDYATSTPTPTIFGRPVVRVQVMPNTDANSQFLAYFGDLGLASKFGEVTGSMAIDVSDQVNFNTDQITIRGKERVAVNVHDVGTASATASLRNAGPMVGLISANS